jgi:hypothetical protein
MKLSSDIMLKHKNTKIKWISANECMPKRKTSTSTSKVNPETSTSLVVERAILSGVVTIYQFVLKHEDKLIYGSMGLAGFLLALLCLSCCFQCTCENSTVDPVVKEMFREKSMSNLYENVKERFSTEGKIYLNV